MYLYAIVKKDFYLLEEQEKFLHPQGGTLPPQRKVKSLNPKNNCLLRENTGFLISNTHDHMLNLHWFACTILNP